MKRLIIILLGSCLFVIVALSGCTTSEISDGSYNPGEGIGGVQTPPLLPEEPPTVPPLLPEEPPTVPPLVPEVPPTVPPLIPEVPPLVPQKQYDQLIVANTSALNIRSGSGTGYSTVGKMDKGDALPYIGVSGDWYKTIYKGVTAYVSTSSCYKTSVEKSSVKRESIIDFGKTLLGFPYVYGAERVHYGNGTKNYNFNATIFDCSSLTQYVYYKSWAINIATTSREQSLQGKTVGEVQRGDLMFFTNESRLNLSGVERIGHVAIYFGNNYILHTASDYAVIEPISDKRWSYFISAKTFL